MFFKKKNKEDMDDVQLTLTEAKEKEIRKRNKKIAIWVIILTVALTGLSGIAYQAFSTYKLAKEEKVKEEQLQKEEKKKRDELALKDVEKKREKQKELEEKAKQKQKEEIDKAKEQSEEKLKEETKAIKEDYDKKIKNLKKEIEDLTIERNKYKDEVAKLKEQPKN